MRLGLFVPSLALAAQIFLLAGREASGATIQFLTPGGSSAGIAYGVDGLNVVGQDVAQHGFLYNGATNKYTAIQPGAGTSAAHGISGNKIVGSWGKLGYLFDGLTYTTLSHPLGVNGTSAWDVDGNNIVGWYQDAAKVAHGFLFNGTSYTTIDYPGAQSTSVYGISGNKLVGYYIGADNRSHGFLLSGSTFTTIDDPLFLGIGTNAVHGIDGNKLVGTTGSSPASATYIYDGTSFSHPFGSELGITGDHNFYGVSGNRIVGEYNDRPFVYIVPEPSSLALISVSATLLLMVAHRRRYRAP